MFCSQCGKEIDDNSKFCAYCGSAQNVTYSPVIKRKNPMAKWIGICIFVLVVVTAGVGLGVLIHSQSGNKGTELSVQQEDKQENAEDDVLQPEEDAEGDVPQPGWKEAYCDFLIAVHSEDMDIINEQYQELSETLNLFFESNYNPYSIEISNKQEASERIAFSLIYLDGDDIPELVLSGDYSGLLFTYQDEAVQLVTWNAHGYDSQFMDYEYSDVYFVEKEGRILVDQWSTGPYLGISLYQYNTDGYAEHLEDIDPIDEPGREQEMEEYKKEINSELAGSYEITSGNIAVELEYEKALSKELELPQEDESNIIDIGEMFMEDMGARDEIRELLAQKYDVEFEENEAGITGYYNGNIVYDQDGDNYFAYSNIKLEDIRVLSMYPGMPTWKAVRLLEGGGFYHSRSDEHNGQIIIDYHNGEDIGDMAVGLYVEDGKVVSIHFYYIA